jgi:hypothetical protein
MFSKAILPVNIQDLGLAKPLKAQYQNLLAEPSHGKAIRQ